MPLTSVEDLEDRIVGLNDILEFRDNEIITLNKENYRLRDDIQEVVRVYNINLEESKQVESRMHEAEAFVHQLSEKNIRLDEQSQLFKSLYEEANAERKLLSERIQKFTGFVKETGELEKKEYTPIRKVVPPWRDTAAILERQARDKVGYWRDKGAVSEEANTTEEDLKVNDAN